MSDEKWIEPDYRAMLAPHEGKPGTTEITLLLSTLTGMVDAIERRDARIKRLLKPIYFTAGLKRLLVIPDEANQLVQTAVRFAEEALEE